MNDAGRRPWLGTALLVGLIYAVIGVVFGALAGSAGSVRLRTAWRMSAWAVSAVVFAAHVVGEHRRAGHAARAAAWRASVAAAAGAFGLALAANLHDLAAPSGYRPRMLVALVAWPLLIGVPAFVVALAAAALLAARRRRLPADAP